MFNERVNFFGSQLAGELWHVTFAVADEVVEVFRGGPRGFVGDERRPTEMAALGRFSVAFRAVFDVHRVQKQPRVSRWSLGRRTGERGR